MMPLAVFFTRTRNQQQTISSADQRKRETVAEKRQIAG
jgi:hypothetical protein